MAKVTLQGNEIETSGTLPNVGAKAPEFTLTKDDLSDMSLGDLAGKKVVLNIFPSVDTSTCANSVRKFNEKASALENTQVVCVAADLPFAMARFCGAEGIENVVNGSSFRSSFGKDYGVEFVSGPLTGLLSRAVVVLNEKGEVVHTEQVAEIADEPDYESALKALGA
ncbi:thiol peroxidase [Bermanella sp. R86510]|uniref:thiol peroxidase n=1 Tax=unclassified Bermanella TaxID=2627862 RepID=UPI0037C86609